MEFEKSKGNLLLNSVLKASVLSTSFDQILKEAIFRLLEIPLDFSYNKEKVVLSPELIKELTLFSVGRDIIHIWNTKKKFEFHFDLIREVNLYSLYQI